MQSNSEFVCGECFGDDGLKDFCANHAERNECDFCGAASDKPIAAPFDDVVDHIRACVHAHYDDPANAGLPYETREGGYQGTTYYTSEVFEMLGLDFPKDKNDHLRNMIDRGMDHDLWSDAEPFLLTPDQRHEYSWKKFCQVIKHEKRFFFMHEEMKEDDEDRYGEDEVFSPAEVLGRIFAYAERANAFVVVPAGSRFYRARFQEKGASYTTAGEIGPPPLSHAIKTNRMSPPGVVMTYVADDRETALAETADAAGKFAVGEFVIDKELLIFDLTRFPYAPSPFAELPDSMDHDPRPPLNFLRKVSHEISVPIKRDDRVHVEYVPTQVVTEYVRTVVRVNKKKIDGVRYNSSRINASTAVVLFADQDDLVFDEVSERPEFYRDADRWLRLVNASVVKVTAKDIARWAKPHRHLFDEN